MFTVLNYSFIVKKRHCKAKKENKWIRVLSQEVRHVDIVNIFKHYVETEKEQKVPREILNGKNVISIRMEVDVVTNVQFGKKMKELFLVTTGKEDVDLLNRIHWLELERVDVQCREPGLCIFNMLQTQKHGKVFESVCRVGVGCIEKCVNSKEMWGWVKRFQCLEKLDITEMRVGEDIKNLGNVGEIEISSFKRGCVHEHYWLALSRVVSAPARTRWLRGCWRLKVVSLVL